MMFSYIYGIKALSLIKEYSGILWTMMNEQRLTRDERLKRMINAHRGLVAEIDIAPRQLNAPTINVNVNDAPLIATPLAEQNGSIMTRRGGTR